MNQSSQLIGLVVGVCLFTAGIVWLNRTSGPSFSQDDSHPKVRSLEHTLAIIKPDAVAAGNVGKIIALIEEHGFKIIDMKKTTLDRATAEKFYAVHEDKPFFKELISFITSGPVVLLALEKENAITDWRMVMGATNPAKADANTIRKLFGTDVGRNAVHGSDSSATAYQELQLFFPSLRK